MRPLRKHLLAGCMCEARESRKKLEIADPGSKATSVLAKVSTFLTGRLPVSAVTIRMDRPRLLCPHHEQHSVTPVYMLSPRDVTTALPKHQHQVHSRGSAWCGPQGHLRLACLLLPVYMEPPSTARETEAWRKETPPPPHRAIETSVLMLIV